MLSIRTTVRGLYILALLLGVIAVLGLAMLLYSKEYIFYSVSERAAEQLAEEIIPFPVGVDQTTKTIVELPEVNTETYETLAEIEAKERGGWLKQVASVFASNAWYQGLASPVSRVVIIWPGERQEEITKNVGDILRWSTSDRETFTHLVSISDPLLREGKFYPGEYLIHRNATPEEVSEMLTDEFNKEILSRYTPEVADQVSLEDALIIASLLEREASDFENMREISGVIWNRLFIDMPLQLDATLQYARGSRTYEPAWWPEPKPRDKYIHSPYNTYQNSGLPPGPIANPSAAAVLAALNPRETDCLFYFHHTNAEYYCSVTYEEHVQKLRNLYGRGR